MSDAAKLTPARRSAAARTGGEFFGRPTGPNHRRYEALRGYLYEGLSIEAAAARSGYSAATLRSLVRDFRAGKTRFFLNPRPGPTRVLTVVGPAGDAVVVGADGLGMKWPRPVVSGGAVVVGVPGLSAR